MRTITRSVGALALAGALASSALAASPTHAQFVAASDRICAVEQAGSNAQGARYTIAAKANDQAGAYAALQAIYAVHLRASRRLAAVPAPAADAALARRYAAVRVQSLALLKEMVDAFAARQATAFQALAAKVNASVAKGQAVARQLGLRVCGS